MSVIVSAERCEQKANKPVKTEEKKPARSRKKAE